MSWLAVIGSLLAGSLVFATSPAHAAATSMDHDFGVYNPASGSQSISTISVTLPNSEPYVVALSPGDGGSYTARKMIRSGGTETLTYNLYIDSSRTVVWGDGTSGTSTQAATGNGSPQNFNVYGAIPSGQAAPPGTYIDNITATVAGTSAESSTFVVTTTVLGPATDFTTGPTATITGTAKVGQTLTAHEGTPSPTPDSFTYAWFANGNPISGATDSTFVPTGSQLGDIITVKVTAQKLGYNDASDESDPTAAVTGTPAAMISPTSLLFSPRPALNQSPAKTVTLKNTGTVMLDVGQVNLRGSNTASFKITSNNCTGRAFAPGRACTIKVATKPTGYGRKTAILAVASNGSVQPLTVTLAAFGTVDTFITSGPNNPTSDRTPRFVFSSNFSSAKFQCRYDLGVWYSCSAPQSHKLKAGHTHTFTVRAVLANGAADTTPASRTFYVKR